MVIPLPLHSGFSTAPRAASTSRNYTGHRIANLIVPEAQNLEAAPVQIGIPCRISLPSLRRVVLGPIDLDDEPLRKAREIDDVGIDGGLPAKMVALPPQLPQLLPQPHFADGRPLAELACPCICHFPAPTPHPRPLPIKGRGDLVTRLSRAITVERVASAGCACPLHVHAPHGATSADGFPSPLWGGVRGGGDVHTPASAFVPAPHPGPLPASGERERPLTPPCRGRPRALAGAPAPRRDGLRRSSARS